MLSVILRLLPSVTNEEQYEKHLCNQSSHYEKYGQLANTATQNPHHIIVNRHLTLSWKRTGTQGRQRQVHDACIVRTAAGEKAHLGMKRHRTVNKSSP